MKLKRKILDIKNESRMNGRRYGIRAILSNPKLYDLFQNIMGSKEFRTNLSSQYIKPRDGDIILDIGCGTAEIRHYLPNVKYYGIDQSSKYIETAKNKLSDIYSDCTLKCSDLNKIETNELPKFDIILAIGVLHHLSDKSVASLAKMSKKALKDNGRLITVDPCYDKNQSFIAKFLVSQDRGCHVRDIDGYYDLMNPLFDSSYTEVRYDLLRFPYTNLIMEFR